MKGTSSTSSLRQRRVGQHWEIVCAWLLACLPAIGACHKSSPSGMMTLLPDGSMDVRVVTDGSVRVTVGSNDCPTVTATVGPATARIGEHVMVSAQASDDDPGAQLTYKWTAANGTFASATAISTTYTCPTVAQAGPQVLTVTVSDGKCAVMRTVTVFCDALVADAGSGGSGGAGGANDGGTAGVSGSMGGAGGAAGSGAGGSGAGGAGGACAGNDPTRCEGDLCNQCTSGVPDGGTDLCDDNPQGCFNCDPAVSGCDMYTSDADRTRCQALYVCVRDNHCTVNLDTSGTQPSLDPSPCYCGNADKTACFAGNSPPIGPCVKQFTDAAKSTSAADVNSRFVDPRYPIGGAINLVICRATACGRYIPVPSNPNPSCPLW